MRSARPKSSCAKKGIAIAYPSPSSITSSSPTTFGWPSRSARAATSSRIRTKSFSLITLTAQSASGTPAPPIGRWRARYTTENVPSPTTERSAYDAHDELSERESDEEAAALDDGFAGGRDFAGDFRPRDAAAGSIAAARRSSRPSGGGSRAALR